MFKGFDRIISKNGKILYNFSYCQNDTVLPYRLVTEIVSNTEWTLADTIIWKKPSTHPINVNVNLTRIWEFVWVFVRKSEVNTYTVRREGHIGKTGQTFYDSVFNFISAPNNDTPTPEINGATFSSNLVEQLLDIYVRDGETVYDPFIGTGTTAVACKRKGIDCIGSEISEKQCEYAKNRLLKVREHRSWFDEYADSN